MSISGVIQKGLGSRWATFGKEKEKVKVGLAWPSAKFLLPVLLGPNLYSSILLQTILCLVHFLFLFFFLPSNALLHWIFCHVQSHEHEMGLFLSVFTAASFERGIISVTGKQCQHFYLCRTKVQ